MKSLTKIDVIEKAARGDLLTPDEEQTLRDCADDYRPMIQLGNGFKITRAQVIEAFEIIFDDVRFMTGDRRQRAIRLLMATGARGFDRPPLAIPATHPTGEHNAEEFGVDVDDDELSDA